MKRRNFIKTSAMGLAAMSLSNCVPPRKTHILSLSWDDGFKKSFYRIAETHEKYGLKACLNIIASAHLKQQGALDAYQNDPVGNFDDWNLLQERGHEIMPHTWEHNDLAKMPFEEATGYIDRCLEYFEQHLDGFKTSQSVYNFAYNSSTLELEAYLLDKVWALRTGGWDVLGEGTRANPFPGKEGPRSLGCYSYGPENADEWVEEEVSRFLQSEGGWLVLNLHGLDDEGWGPVSSSYLDKLLQKLVRIETLDILPTGMVLKKYRVNNPV